MVKSFKSGKIFGKGQEKWKGERQDLIQKAEDLGDGSRCVTLSIYNSDASLWSTAGSWAPVVKLGCNTLITWSQERICLSTGSEMFCYFSFPVYAG